VQIIERSPSKTLLESGYSYLRVNRSADQALNYLPASNTNFGNFHFANIFGVSDTTLNLHYNAFPNENDDQTTQISLNGQNSMNAPYLVNIKFIPEPCSPDRERPILMGTTTTNTGDFMP